MHYIISVALAIAVNTFVLSTWPLSALAQSRVALVIGNSAYQHTPTLANPKNDATDIGAALKRVGFQVIDGFDLDKANLDRKIRDFGTALQGANLGVFFYAGHGLQVAGQNYLIPIDAQLNTIGALDTELVRLGLVQRTMAREDRTSILFVDASRDNPLARNLAGTTGPRSGEIGRGLAPTESAVRTIISFSTQPGNVALDGSGRNSPFTGALVKSISSNDDLNTMLASVRRDVMSETQGRQVPWYQTTLSERIYLNPGQQVSSAPKGSVRVGHLMTEEEIRKQGESAALDRGPGQDARTDSLRNPCGSGVECTLVQVFFGTDRQQSNTPTRIDFGGARDTALHLGRAIVTVPRAENRKLGSISRPTWWDRYVIGVPAGGDPAKHFTIPKDGVTIIPSEALFLVAISEHMKEVGEFKEHAFVFVHGANTTFEFALYRTAQIAFDLGSDGRPFGTAFLYSWPSQSGIENYTYDFDSARFTVDHLVTFLTDVAEKTAAKYVHVIAHSMGNWPLMVALEQVARSSKVRSKLSQVILAAPDVDAEEFTKMAKKILPSAKGLTLYVSSSDGAMIASRKVHANAFRAGDVAPTGPVMITGVDTIDVSLVSTDVFSLAHSEYAERRELLNDIALILRKGMRPPNKRTPILQTVRLQGQQYWRFPAN